MGLLWLRGDGRDVKVEEVVRLVSPDVGTVRRPPRTLVHTYNYLGYDCAHKDNILAMFCSIPWKTADPTKDVQARAKEKPLFEFPTFLLPTNLEQPMHSQSAMTELP